MASAGGACPICDKHRGVGALVGPVLWSDEHVVVTHRPVDPAGGSTVAGYVFIESRRHVERWQHLDAHEMAAAARVAWWAAQVLAARFGTEDVHSAIVGLRVPHFHQHVFVRHLGTPDATPWHAPGTWDGAPRVGAEALADLAQGLRARFAALALESG